MIRQLTHRLVLGAGLSVLAAGGAPIDAQAQAEASESIEAEASVTAIETATGTAENTANTERMSEDEMIQISAEESQPPSPPTAQEVDSASAVDAMTREFEHYLRSADSFRADIKALIEIRYNQERNRINDQFETRIVGLEKKERTRRLEAIARFEEFLQKYPNNEFYSPDAMFRLAELYFEKSSDEYLQSTRVYEDQLEMFEAGQLAAEPDAPVPSFDKTIELYVDLLARFPEYRHADAARYLLGFSYEEQDNTEQALVMYTELIAKNPDSRFSAEVWTRIGEIYFDENAEDSLPKAADAYAHVLEYRDSPYYDKALYKLAWTHYRMDDYDRAVTEFLQLVDYADEQKKLTGKTGSELRAEAIQYVAISLSDEGWGGLDRAKTVLAPLDDKIYAAEIWKRYGEILFDQTRYPQSIEVMRLALQKYPNAPTNPAVQAKIVEAYERQRDFEGSARAREVLVAKYDKGSEWNRANQNDQEALGLAETLTEQSLQRAALFYHKQAQAYKKNSRAADARSAYERAADNYRRYLKRFPESKTSYDFTFFLAECLYYSDDYLGAAARYEEVRDSNSDNRHLADAAHAAVLSYEKLIEKEEQTGKLTKHEPLKAADRKDTPIDPKPIPKIRGSLINASDRFTTLLPDNERAPAVMYRAAETYYVHDQFPEARKRFEAVVVSYPGTDVARFSANLIIESYLATSDWDNVEKWSQRLIDLNDKSAPTTEEEKKARAAFAAKLKDFKVGARFKKAEQLVKTEQFEAAADLYVKLVDESPDHEFADKALFNAAIAYEKVKRFDTASKVYQRIYDNYPKSSLADRALFRVGVNYEKGFDFPAAVSAYTKLVERYPNSEHRADALYNVAVTLENMQQYGQSASAFKRYAQTFPKREDAGDVFFRAALVYEKMKAWPETISTLRDFIKKYGGSRAQRERIVESYKKMGEAYAKMKKDKNSVSAYKSCVGEYKRRGFSATNRASAFAGQCAFEIAEEQFRRYDAVAIKGTGRKQAQALKKKAQMQQQIEKMYRGVFQYKRAETTLAALYRIGYSYERFAESMFKAEVPPEFRKNQELADEYRVQLEEKAGVLERKAERAYRVANEEAIKTRVINEWTQRILEGLNKYAPQEFPVQHRGKSSLQTTTVSGNGLDRLDGDPRGAPPASPPPAESSAPDAAENPGGAK